MNQETLNQLKAEAVRIHQMTFERFELDDAMSASIEGYYMARQTFDESLNVPFECHVHNQVKTMFDREIRSMMRCCRLDKDLIENNVAYIPGPEQVNIWKDTIEKLSNDAKVMVEYALNEESKSPCKIRKTLKDFLKECGWSMDRIKKGFQELKEVFYE